MDMDELHLAGRIAREHLGAWPRVRHLASGSCSDNYLAELPDTRIVVKLSKASRELRALGDYEKERWCIGQARRLGIPSPEVLALGTHDGRAYMLQTFLDHPLPASDNPAVWEALGDYARRIHSVTTSGWGDVFTDGHASVGDWNRYLEYNLASLGPQDPLVAMGLLTESTSREIRGRFEDLKKRDFTFALCHGDLAPFNTLLAEGGEVYLLDWGCARSEIVPYFEINEILSKEIADQRSWAAFLNGYGLAASEFAGLREDLDTLALLRAIDTMRWGMDRAPREIPRLAGKLRSALARMHEG